MFVKEFYFKLFMLLINSYKKIIYVKTSISTRTMSSAIIKTKLSSTIRATITRTTSTYSSSCITAKIKNIFF